MKTEASTLSATPDTSTTAGGKSRLVRRSPAPMALEQRFMFDGAAVAEAVSDPLPSATDHAHGSDTGVLDFGLSASLLPAAVNTARSEVEDLLAGFFQQPESQGRLFDLFAGGQNEITETWQHNADALSAALQDGRFSTAVELRSADELQGALGAFAADSHTGSPLIYLNADYADTASKDAIKAVLLEELGHAIDHALNGAADSTGDEGHAFAAMLLHGDAGPAAAGLESDQRLLTLDGQTISVEEAAPYNIAQTTFVPLPEPDIQTSLKAIAGSSAVSGNIETIIAISSTSDGTVVVYDHWEDGYEADIKNPTQASTQIWGDGITSNGTAPGTTNDLFGAGQTILLRQSVNPASPGTLDYDGRDKIGSTKAVSVTRAGWSATPGTVLAGAVSAIDAANAGKDYVLPIGQNVITAATDSPTNRLFEYTSAHIIAMMDGTTVNIDKDGNGTIDQTVSLNQGQTYMVNGGIMAGARITADKGIGVYAIAGDVASAYENRWFAITPREQWSSSYYAPVGTTLAADPTHVFLYNPDPLNPITVYYDTRTGTSSVTVPANTTRFVVMPASAAHFYTRASGGSQAPRFYAISTIDSDATSNATHDWSYSLVPESYLTDKFIVAWGPGNNSSPTSAATNGSPVWVTATADTLLYIDSNSVTVKDSSGKLVGGTQVDANTYKYAIKALESYRLFDTSDNDQSGLTVYTVDGTLITGAWGEDPSIAGAGNPYLDMGTTVLPYPDYVFTKDSAEATVNSDGDGEVELGEDIEYTLSIVNRSVIDMFNPVITDSWTPASAINYVVNSASLTVYDTDGITILRQITDLDGSAAVLPLLTGYTLTDTNATLAGEQGLGRGQKIVVSYRLQLPNAEDTAKVGLLQANNFQVNNSAQVQDAEGITKQAINISRVIVDYADGEVQFKNAGYTAAVSSYGEGETLYLEVSDADANLNNTAADTLRVTVSNTSTGEQETVILTETGNSSGIFQGTLATSTSVSHNTDHSSVLTMTAGAALKVEYTDPVYGSSFDNPATPDGDPATTDPVRANVATASVAIPSKTKILYLSGSGDLDRIDPVNSGDTSLVSSSALSPSAGATTWTSYDSDNGNSDRTIDRTEARGQTFRVEGSGTYAVDSVSLYLKDDDSTPNTNVSLQLFLESSWGASTTPVATLTTALSSSYGWVRFDFASPVTLDKGTSYVLRLKNASTGSSNTTTSIDWRRDDSGTYAGGTALNSSGDTDAARDMIFKVEGGASASGTPATFTQSIPMATAFALPAGGEVKVLTHVSAETGLVHGSSYAGITAALTWVPAGGGTAVTIATLGPATYSDSNNDGTGTLGWSGTVAAGGLTLPKGASVSLVITNGQSGSSFRIDYDAASAPSRIELPTTTVIDIVDVDGVDANNDGDLLDAAEGDNGNGMQEIGLYTASHAAGGGSLITGGAVDAGAVVYVRVKVSDPFGDQDINDLALVIDGPGSTADISTSALSAPSLVKVVDSDDNGPYRIYEYAWQTVDNSGVYSIGVTAREGYENTISDTASTTLTVTSRDLGTPSVTEFITALTGSSGITAGTSYAAGANAYLRVTDMDEAGTGTVRASVNGVQFTLNETGTGSGIFETALSGSYVDAGGATRNFTNLQLGQVLLASYTDNGRGDAKADSTDSSSATISVPVPSNSAPVARDNSYSTPEDESLSGNLISDASADSDADSDTLTLVNINGTSFTVGAPIALSYGTLTITNANGAFTYTPNANDLSGDSFSYTISDGKGGFASATVTLGVTAVNDAPVAKEPLIN